VYIPTRKPKRHTKQQCRRITQNPRQGTLLRIKLNCLQLRTGHYTNAQTTRHGTKRVTPFVRKFNLYSKLYWS
jgi:hypothetical protein